VNSLLYEQRDLTHCSGLSCESKEEIKKEISSYNIAVHDIKTYKTFTRYLPAVFHNCLLTPAVTTDVYR